MLFRLLWLLYRNGLLLTIPIVRQIFANMDYLSYFCDNKSICHMIALLTLIIILLLAISNVPLPKEQGSLRWFGAKKREWRKSNRRYWAIAPHPFGLWCFVDSPRKAEILFACVEYFLHICEKQTSTLNDSCIDNYYHIGADLLQGAGAQKQRR